MAPTGETLTIPEDDPTRRYGPEEVQRLTANLAALEADVERGALAERPIDRELVCHLHRRLFDGVRDHAGRHRTPGFGQEHLTFGPHRSMHRDRVRAEMDGLCRTIAASIESCRASTGDPTYERQAFHVAVWAHARLIWIHPFEDGNGRTGRLLLSELLVRFGLVPVTVYVPKAEYLAVLNHFYTRGAIDPLLEFFLDLYRVTLLERARQGGRDGT